MTAFAIRLLALVTMLLDHLGYRMFTHMPWLRIVGRLAFPLFCFLIAEGFHHTRDRKKYALRLLLLAVASEVPYDLFLRNRLWYPGGQNVYWTLLLGLLAAWWVRAVWETMLPARRGAPGAKASPLLPALRAALALSGVGLACGLAYLLKTDYGFYGVALIVMFSLLREKKDWRVAAFFWLVAAYVWYSIHIRGGGTAWAYTQLYATLAIVPILLYNDKPGPKNKALQWGFYFFYPAHLLVLWAIWQFL